MFGETSTLLWIAALSASALAWLAIARRKFSRQPIVPHAARRVVPWRGAGVLVALVCWLFIRATGAGIFLQVNPPHHSAEQEEAIELPDDRPSPEGQAAIEEQAASSSPEVSTGQILVDALCSLVAVLAVCVLMQLAVASSWDDFGLQFDFAWPDVRIGMLAGVALIPGLLLLQMWLTQWFPSKHTIVELFEQKSDTYTMAAMFLSAVVVAPVAEEFFIRAILQGWLEKVSHEYQAAWQQGNSATPSHESLRQPRTEEMATQAEEPEEGFNTDQPLELSPNPADEAEPLRGWFAILPVLFSSVCFAAMHFGYGPDPIPIFLFALVLGYLYQRTHRLLPSITLHALLNATSLALLWLSF